MGYMTSRAPCFLGHLLTAATVVFLVSGIRLVEAVIPSVELSFFTSGNDNAEPTSLLVSQAYYGTEPPLQGSGGDDSPKSLVSPPENDLFLCQKPDEIDIDENVLEFTEDTWIAVPRGGCTYEHKTWVAQSVYKAHGVIIYNTLGSRYSFNKTDNTIMWPLEHHDYDCDNARAEIPSNELNFYSDPDEAKSSGKAAVNGPYDFETNDALLSGDTVDNLCKIHDANGLRNCPSKRCLVAHQDATNATATDTTTVCCAWDILLNPYPDTDLDQNVTINIPTLFATMEQWDVLSSALDTSSSVTILAYKRWRPTFNFSFVLIVLLGGFVAAFAAFHSADDYHVAISKLWRPKPEGSGGNANRNTNPNQQQDRLVPRSNTSLAEESLELEPIHALLFLVMSSISLFILFFFKVRYRWECCHF